MTRFTTTSYMASHGREPTGTGVWVFECEYSHEQYQTPRACTLTQAKAMATKQFRPNSVLKVCA